MPRLAARLALLPAALAAAAALSAPAPASAAAAPAARPAAVVYIVKTTVRGLVIRALPSTMAAKVATLGPAGTRIGVTCWTAGTPVLRNSVWYRTVSPRLGYVASVYTTPRPVKGLPPCKPVKPFRRTYLTKVAGLAIRTGPSTTFRVVGKTGPAGSKVVVRCWTRGQSVRGDNVWYGTVSPFTGYTAGRYLNTGADPAPGVPHC